MTDREILQKCIDLEKSCSMDKEKKEVMDMLYKYKEAVSLRDEIGACPDIEVDCLQSRKYCEAIMDDLLLFTPSKGSYVAKLEDLLKALLRNGLKISLKKCQLFRT